jgi:hypothetical protein
VAYATVDELAAALRIRVTVENTPALQACLDAAAHEINHEIDLVLEEGTVHTAVPYLFSASIQASDPGAGFVRYNKASTPATTQLYVDVVDAEGTDHAAALQEATTTDVVELVDAAAADIWERFQLTGPAVDNSGWFMLPVGFLAASTERLDRSEGKELAVVTLRPARLLPPQELALANQVNIVRGVEWYKSSAAAFGVIGFDESGTLRAPRDGFSRHAYALSPLKAQWGVA